MRAGQLVADNKRWWAERERQRQERAAEQRAEFFADRTDIPDLEFLTPDCPVCDLPTTAEDGQFICDGCRITWPANGYGHQAERWPDDE